jgi:hypothetical protein
MNEQANKQEPVTDPWSETTFEGSELATLRHAAKLTFVEKLKWLEDAHRLSLKFQETRRKMGLKTIFPDGRIEV